MMNKGLVFVIDDEANVCTMVREALEGEGFKVQYFENPARGLEALQQKQPELLITDLVMSEMDGLELIRRSKTVYPDLSIVVITGHASLESAIGAIRAGANDYLVKPFRITQLMESVTRALSQKRIMQEDAGYHHKALQERYETKNLIGSTPEIKEVYRLVEKIAKTESTVLIVGESGTGKEMVARSIHFNSKRRKGPFVSINCAALPETLLESELFGYEKGAFTGAVSFKMGLFELAGSGTLFLDEVGEMPLVLQVKLLRALQERAVKRLGGIRDIPVDFRLIAATSLNLTEEIKGGRFREDLFYRLNVIPILMPPLRQRGKDIPLFVSHFLSYFAQRQNLKQQFMVTDEALSAFQNYAWPGNIRELENVIERLVALAEGSTIDARLAHGAIQGGNFSSLSKEPIHDEKDLKISLESYERDLIEKAIGEANGNQNRAAKKLNLTRQALHYKLKKYGIVSRGRATD